MKQPLMVVIGKRRLRQRKKRFIVETLGGKCANCGSTEHLQLDHPNHDRKYHDGIVTKSWAFIKEEIRDKRLLCIVCNSTDGGRFGQS